MQADRQTDRQMYANTVYVHFTYMYYHSTVNGIRAKKSIIVVQIADQLIFLVKDSHFHATNWSTSQKL